MNGPNDAPYYKSGQRPGALLIHGLSGSPRSMRPLAEAIAATGRAVSAPLLPGHGTFPEDLAEKRFSDFERACADEAGTVVDDEARLVLIGHSMGGALAASLAGRRRAAPLFEVLGLVLVNPFLAPPTESFNELLRAALDAGSSELPPLGPDLMRSGVETGGYDRLSIVNVLDLSESLGQLQEDLSTISCPILVFESRVDHVVPPFSSRFIDDLVAGPVERVELEHSYHLATLDNDACLIVRKTLAFLDKVWP